MDHTNVSRQRWHDHWLFLTHFRKSPRTVGAIAPSSQQLARGCSTGSSSTPGTRLVELGPGTGAITGEIDRRLPDSRRRASPSTSIPCSVRASASRWPRIVSVCDRAERLAEIAGSRDLLPVDHIVSGLPFASLPAASASRHCRRHRRVAAARRHIYDLSIRSRVRVPLRRRRPSDPDDERWARADQLAGPWQPASGIGAPLAQAKIGRAP